MDRKEILSKKKRIVIKVGTTTITYEETGNINLDKLEKFVRILINLRNQGKEMRWDWITGRIRKLRSRHVLRSDRAG